jgi:hypothetical protein
MGVEEVSGSADPFRIARGRRDPSVEGLGEMPDGEGPFSPPGFDRDETIREIETNQAQDFRGQTRGTDIRDPDSILEPEEVNVPARGESRRAPAEDDGRGMASRTRVEDGVQADVFAVPETEAGKRDRLLRAADGLGQQKKGPPAAFDHPGRFPFFQFIFQGHDSLEDDGSATRSRSFLAGIRLAE